MHFIQRMHNGPGDPTTPAPGRRPRSRSHPISRNFPFIPTCQRPSRAVQPPVYRCSTRPNYSRPLPDFLNVAFSARTASRRRGLQCNVMHHSLDPLRSPRLCARSISRGGAEFAEVPARPRASCLAVSRSASLDASRGLPPATHSHPAALRAHS